MHRLIRAAGAGCALAMIASGPAAAVPDKELARCAAISNDLERLDCFDALAREAGVAGPKVETQEPAGQWSLRTETSPIDDSTNVFLTVTGSATQGRYGRSATPVLYVRCKENTTAIIVNWGQFITTQDAYVTWRIDDAPAQEARWGMATNNEATGKWRGATAIPFVKKLFGHDELLMRVTPHGENAVTTSFPITGLETAIAPLRDACNW